MQVPAKLVGLAAVWERRWSLGRRGPCCCPVGVSGKALAGAPARVLPRHCGLPWQASCRGSRGFPRLGSRQGSSSSGPHLISYVLDLDKDLHATTEVPPEPWFQCGCWRRWNPRAQGWLALLVLGKLPRQGSCRGCGGCLGKDLAEGVYLALLPSCVSGLGIALVVLCFGFSPASLLCSAKCGRGAWLSLPVHRQRGQKERPYFCTPTAGADSDVAPHAVPLS